MEIHIPADLEPFVAECVASGRYRSPSDVVMLGLYLLQDQELLRKAKTEALRAEIQKGLDQVARGESLPGEEFMDELERGILAKINGAA